MIEYEVILKRGPRSSRPDVCIFRDEDREKAINEMLKYTNKYGFTVLDKDGRYTIANVELVEREPIVGAPVISRKSWIEIFDETGARRKE